MTRDPSLTSPVPSPRRGAEPGDVGVLVAGGSPLSRRAVRTMLSGDPRFEVVGEARTRSDLLTLAARFRPSAVVLDPDLPHGVLPALAELMATHPVPVVIYGNHDFTDPGLQASLLAAGAVDIIVRPRGAEDGERLGPDEGEALRSCVLLASRIRVIRHPRGRLPRLRSTVTTTTPVVIIGASTGGPNAVGAVLAGLPADLKAAVVVVQHMPANFLSGFATWLNGCCPLPVRLGADGDLLQAGEVLICPGGQDSVIDRAAQAAGRLRCSPAAPPAHHVPSVDRAFSSVAAAVGGQAVGALLTGMGRDGAAGMAALRAAGAATIAQDESTSAIYGMPRAAVAAGVVDQILPLPEIAGALRELVAQRLPTHLREGAGS